MADGEQFSGLIEANLRAIDEQLERLHLSKREGKFFKPVLLTRRKSLEQRDEENINDDFSDTGKFTLHQ